MWCVWCENVVWVCGCERGGCVVVDVCVACVCVCESVLVCVCSVCVC